MLRKNPIHPILFGLFPVLSLYSLNTALVPTRDVVWPLLLILGGTCFVWLILGLILRSSQRGAMGASVSVVLFFAFGHAWDLVHKQKLLSKLIPFRGDFLPFWLAVFIVAVILACWKWKRIDGFTSAMNVGGIVLAGFPFLSILISWFSAWHGTSIGAMSGQETKLKVDDRPDIYYIILDGYGRSDSLKRVIGFSNDWFIKGLESRGFFVATDSKSNYCQTELSLSSSLNLGYLPKVLPDMSPSWTDRTVLDGLIDENQVSKYLKKIGYRYEAVTTGFPSVRPYSADLWFHSADGLSYFSGVLLNEIPVSPSNDVATESQYDSRRQYLNGALTHLQESVSTSQPRFIFAHILAPHPPFVFDENGKSVAPTGHMFAYVDASDFFDYGGTVKEYRDGYTGQATYLSKRILQVVDQILKSSTKPPVIILQGDHGSKMRMSQTSVDKSDLNECFPNLNAYFVPKSVRANLYPGITPVNSFRMLFNGLFDDHFTKLPDESFYSSWLTPFKFIDVTKRIRPVSP